MFEKGQATYREDALANGANEVIQLPKGEMPHWINEAFGHPSRNLKVIGVTGTNGKTTVTQLIQQVLTTLGYSSVVQGTLNSRLTTPDLLETLKSMQTHLDNEGTHFVMEVSSHGIHQGRVDGIDFAVKVLTNITQDHLDYHGTFEAYQATKMAFMQDGNGAKIYPEDYDQVVVDFPHLLKGRFNTQNLKAVVAALSAIGIQANRVKATLKDATGPRGRFEWVDAGQPFGVVVDYAHTPDGLDNIASECRHLVDAQGGRLITVFGCGGDRDRGKRPKMGAIATQWSHQVVLTMDNPRTEDPTQIMTDILSGIPDKTKVIVEPDRHEAIRLAIAAALPNDIVLIAGKGHETDQIFATSRIHFDDREEAHAAITSKIT